MCAMLARALFKSRIYKALYCIRLRINFFIRLQLSSNDKINFFASTLNSSYFSVFVVIPDCETKGLLN